MSNKDFFFGKRKIKVKFGQPIYQEELKENVDRHVQPGENVYKEEAQYVIDKVKTMLSTI
jgi:hypothetical protein